MADKIRLLPEVVANQIAAGEVVNRPSSVVKEMMENAIDAGARSVKVNFRDGGKDLIQIVDDGCGMSPIVPRKKDHFGNADPDRVPARGALQSESAFRTLQQRRAGLQPRAGFDGGPHRRCDRAPHPAEPPGGGGRHVDRPHRGIRGASGGG